MPRGERRLGVISDTHGLLRPEAVAALRGSDRIIHAGDVGAPGILDALSRLAPVIAVRGNIDLADWAAPLPVAATLELGGVRIHVVHDLADLDLDPLAAGIDVVVSGHSHRPGLRRQGRVLFLNPGSAGRRRFALPVSLARLRIFGGEVSANLIELQIAGSASGR